MKYEVPFRYPEGLSLITLNRMLLKYNLTIHPSDDQLVNGLPRYIGEYLITGTQENLIPFFRDIDGPGEPFSATEFINYIQDYALEA